MRNHPRHAGVLFGSAVLLVMLAVVAGFLVAGVTLPFLGGAAIVTRNASDTFSSLQVGTLGTPPTRSALYDAEGRVLTYFYPGDVYRVPVSYNQIAAVMRDAIVAVEDDSFYNQGALDPRGTVRALLSDISGAQLQGASTLAQQYVKNVKILQAGSNAKAAAAAAYPDLRRKIQQLRIAASVEHEMTQDQLLAAYLNVAYFDNHAWGIQVASEVYFSEPASKLTLPQAALLAGIVQSPTAYDPLAHPAAAKARRNEVLARMAAVHDISPAAAAAAKKLPVKLHTSVVPLQTGCLSPHVTKSAFFCDYVQHVLELQYPALWNEITTTGGLNIYTTLSMRDQLAADHAVNWVEPQHSGGYNPGHNADTEVLIQPGTGDVRAIAINRTFGVEDLNYAVNSPYGGGAGVQTGSSAKIFTLVTALEHGDPFGHKITVTAPVTMTGYTNCQGHPITIPWKVTDAEGPTIQGSEIWPLYSATVQSINVYFAHLEKQVGLCNVVKTAVQMGMTRADGRSLLKPEGKYGTKTYQPSADNLPGFTLGEVNVSPMNMAAAYASVAARGMYCAPRVIVKIVSSTGQSINPQPQQCHRDMPQGVADAANYILQGVLSQPGGTAYGQGIGRPAAGKTGTSDGGYYAAFAGYTPTLAGYVSVFNPNSPTGSGAMIGSNSDYRTVSGYLANCGGQMYGACAPAATWQDTFLHAQLGSALSFPPAPKSYFSQGPGNGGPQQAKKPKPKHQSPSPSPTATPVPAPSPTHTRPGH